MRDNSERCSHGRKVESMRPRELVAGGWLRRSVVGVALALPSGIAAVDLSGWEIETEICRSGISVVGGSATLTLAVYHPDQFRYAGSFSGYSNISVPRYAHGAAAGIAGADHDPCLPGPAGSPGPRNAVLRYPAVGVHAWCYWADRALGMVPDPSRYSRARIGTP
ncbi:alpha/beta hydrolase-fold protein [Nocardia sp. NPDC050412]|uniref:alpha/beta hydrolase-fold protein n=1 Tax=Nocardia sp. NPDC050412 TaxID=3364320 RepID=UPI0037952E90